MDLVAADGGVFAAGLHGAVLVGIGQDEREVRVPLRAVDRRLNVARLDVLPRTDLAPRLVDAVTDDAGDALARGRRPVHLADGDRLVEGHAGLGVTANAEVAVGAVGQLDGRVRHGVEHGAYLRVGVRRHRPFAEMALVTFRALLRRREGVVVETGRVGLVDRLLGGVVPHHRRRRLLRAARRRPPRGLVGRPTPGSTATAPGRRRAGRSPRPSAQPRQEPEEPAPLQHPSQPTCHGSLLFPEVPALSAEARSPGPIVPSMEGETRAGGPSPGSVRPGGKRRCIWLLSLYRIGDGDS